MGDVVWKVQNCAVALGLSWFILFTVQRRYYNFSSITELVCTGKASFKKSVSKT